MVLWPPVPAPGGGVPPSVLSVVLQREINCRWANESYQISFSYFNFSPDNPAVRGLGTWVVLKRS